MAANMIRMASQQDSHGHIVLDKEKLISATLTNLEIGFALARRQPGKIRKLFVRDDGPSMKDAEIVKTEIRIWKDIALKQGSTLSRVIIVKSLSGFYGHGDEPSMELTATVMSDLEQSFELGAKLGLFAPEGEGDIESQFWEEIQRISPGSGESQTQELADMFVPEIEKFESRFGPLSPRSPQRDWTVFMERLTRARRLIDE